jgi:hypothetical protein
LGQLIQEEPWEVWRFHLWYIHASNLGMKEFIQRFPKEYFHLDEDAYFSIVFHDMHRLLWHKDLDITQVTLLPCKLLHLCIAIGN